MGLNQYNSTVTGKILLTPDLMVLRIRADKPRNKFSAGQYTQIGLMENESRSANSVLPYEKVTRNSMITRPYSIASSGNDAKNFEFYISQIKSGQLTPRLFNLTPGRRMWIDEEIHGTFKLKDTPKKCNIVMVATGTGFSPFISFLRTNLNEYKDVNIALFHGAAQPWDLGYSSEMNLIENTFNNFSYLPTLLKADDNWEGLKGYIEKHLNNKILEERCDIEILPEKTHFFLCGNPKMIETMTKFLGERNYSIYSEGNPQGALHIEEY